MEQLHERDATAVAYRDPGIRYAALSAGDVAEAKDEELGPTGGKDGGTGKPYLHTRNKSFWMRCWCVSSVCKMCGDPTRANRHGPDTCRDSAITWLHRAFTHCVTVHCDSRHDLRLCGVPRGTAEGRCRAVVAWQSHTTASCDPPANSA